MKSASRFTPWLTLFILMTLIGLALPAPISNAQNGATYPIVDTGQDQCYNNNSQITTCPAEGEAFYGQDAQHTGNAPSYTDNGDGTTTDNVTGLMWQQSPDTQEDNDIDADDKLTYEGATTYCENLTLAGHTDWRLPDIKQLYSLIDFRGEDISGYNGTDTAGLTPFIDTDYFDFAYGDTNAGERLIDAQYASSTLYVSNTTNDGGSTMFGVNFADGRIKGYGLNIGGNDKEFFVICVRGNTDYGVNNFIDNGDTITDNATGLMWATDDNGQGLDWAGALEWVATQNSNNHLGYSDWRLPNAKELQSLVDYSRSPDTTNSAAIDPLFNATGITNEDGQTDWPWYWASTTHIKSTGTAAGASSVYLAFGRAGGWQKSPPTATCYSLLDVHGAGAQRSDPKTTANRSTIGTACSGGTAYGNGPQGDAQRAANYVRLVRDTEVVTTPTPTATATPSGNYQIYLPLVLKNSAADTTDDPTPTPTATAAPTAAGYNLFTPLGETTTYLIDEAGDTLYTWDSSYRPGNAVYLLENGTLLRTGNTRSATFDVGGAGGIVEAISPTGAVNWSYTYDSAQGRLHHDIEPLPNGNILMIAWELKSEAEAAAAGRSYSGEVWPDTVIEVDPTTDTIVWEWRVWDHLIQDHDSTKANYGVVADHPELIDLNYYGPGTPPGEADWNHTNSIDYNAEFDQILLSVRNFSEIWVIDHSTTTAEAAGHSGGNSGKGGNLLYRWGNPAAYDAGDAADQQLFVQHDAQWIPDDYPGGGNILIFNNGGGRADGDYSSIEEIGSPVEANGSYSGYGPTAPTWRYTAPTPTDFYAMNISGVQRLSDGNTLICDGPAGDFFEVDADGNTVWEYDYGDKAIFRVTRYPADYAGLPAF